MPMGKSLGGHGLVLWTPTDAKADLFPEMEKRAAEFGIKLARLPGQIYKIHVQVTAYTDPVTGGPWSFEVAFAKDVALDQDFFRMSWCFDTPYNIARDTLTAYARQWGYPETPAWNPDAPDLWMVGGFVQRSLWAFAQKWHAFWAKVRGV
jgi:hypothetical protein